MSTTTTRPFISATNGRIKARFKEPKPRRANPVLAERNQAVAAVGAWVESGQDFHEHPAALAQLTEESQAERRRENEERLRRFQDRVRHRVATTGNRKKLSPHTHSQVTRQQAWTEHVCTAGDALQKSSSMRSVRLRLASCRMTRQEEEVTSQLPGGEWNSSTNRHRAESRVLRSEEEEEDDESGLFTTQHECPLVKHKLSGHTHEEPETDPGLQSDTVPLGMLPLKDQEELKRQRESRFLLQRRLYMSLERERVKENDQHRKHLKKNARIKAEKEAVRVDEERRLEMERGLSEAKQKLRDREQLIQERLKLEREEEEKNTERESRRRAERGRETTRFIEALKARLKERLPPDQTDLPPLCCCAATLWDSHPDTCANNCVFYHNPKAYAKALRSTMLSLDQPLPLF